MAEGFGFTGRVDVPAVVASFPSAVYVRVSPARPLIRPAASQEKVLVVGDPVAGVDVRDWSRCGPGCPAAG